MAIYQIVQIINMAFNVLVWLIIARCILSFVRHNPYQPLIKFVYDVTEPIMAPFRRLIPAAGGLDFSPIIAVLAVTLIQKIVVELLYVLL
ncbi:MAG: YggT family protein [Syntrophomonas sp.]|uniref:YggT family protein n=1 Tax=Syntrophomonas sp. TaxID=2053627 RepID=UPI002630B96C|nr:YggT family protein [Syntrophomonas sp.]MDD2510624.1 YggT family protein [Syntrophomonas sp.]MDD3880414.1 YggT family protein [Syntrophomonas sp.]MDD4626742.1 YggT family protein [Syntrophomonas sp.]